MKRSNVKHNKRRERGNEEVVWYHEEDIKKNIKEGMIQRI